MKIEVIDHPLVASKLSLLRNENTNTTVFRSLVDELVELLVFQATKNLETQEIIINTPLEQTKGIELKKPLPIAIPILRAGLGLLPGFLKMIPNAPVGFLGMQRDEKTLEIHTYAKRLPESLSGRHCFILDPMLATGGTLAKSFEYVAQVGAKKITMITLVSSPKGIETVQKVISELRNKQRSKEIEAVLVTGAIDRGLNDKAYIVPGLGDAGDRLYGEV